MTGREIKKIVQKISIQMGIKKNIRIRVVPFKNKIASISLDSGVLRISRDLAGLSDVSLLKYILIHELIHIKIGHRYHDNRFYQEIKKYLLGESIGEYDKKIYSFVVKLRLKN